MADPAAGAKPCDVKFPRGLALPIQSISTQEGWVKQHRPLSTLCEKCQTVVAELYRNRNVSNFAVGHHDNFAALQSSAKGGCALCYQFTCGFYDFDGEHACRETKRGIVTGAGPWRAEQTRLWLEIPCVGRDLEPCRDQVRHLTDVARIKDGADVTCDADSSFYVRLIVNIYVAEQDWSYGLPNTKASTMDALPMCKAWLQECYSLHKDCATPRNASGDGVPCLSGGTGRSLPTRLIAVDGDELCLCFSRDVEADARYVTLSHRWGSLQFIILTSATMEQFQHRIPSATLPKTFQDAVHICRYLGFRYLWIDSLCILQDSLEDWENESRRMAQVYGGADLNIAATAAENGRGGCFAERADTWRCQVCPDPEAGALYNCIALGWDQAHLKNRLVRRAWVCQERHLSRRTLHFTENQVFWECDGKPACEVFPRGYPSTYDGLAMWKTTSTSFVMQRRLITLDRWPDIVENYSRGVLTKSTDKLVALGGLARIVHAQSGATYIAGIWRENLAAQLLWYLADSNRGTKIDPPMAPTWSWASLNGRIVYRRFGRDEMHVCVHVDSLQFQHSSVCDPFGGVVNAVLRLRCESLYSVTIEHLGHPSDLEIQFGCEHGRIPGTLVIDCREAEVKLEGRNQSTPAYFLPIVFRAIKSRPRLSTSHAFGLVLEPTGRERGQYRRIGYYNTIMDPVFKDADCVAKGITDAFLDVAQDGTSDYLYRIDLV